jgi:hypothetical protein
MLSSKNVIESNLIKINIWVETVRVKVLSLKKAASDALSATSDAQAPLDNKSVLNQKIVELTKQLGYLTAYENNIGNSVEALITQVNVDNKFYPLQGGRKKKRMSRIK